jgi:hypothetical protein
MTVLCCHNLASLPETISSHVRYQPEVQVHDRRCVQVRARGYHRGYQVGSRVQRRAVSTAQAP